MPFTARSEARISDAVRTVERQIVNPRGRRRRSRGRGSGIRFGKLDAELSAGGSVTMSVWAGDPLADTGENITVNDWFLGTGGTLASTTKVHVERYAGRWYVVDTIGGGDALLWGRVQSDITNGLGVANILVSIKDCTWDGTVNGSAFNAKTPYLSVSSTYGPGKDTALWEDYLVNYQLEPDGTFIIISDIWDDAIGTIKAWNISATFIRDGWREMDGSAGSDDTRGRYLRGEDTENVAGRGTVALGGTGGSPDTGYDHGDCVHSTTSRAYTNSGEDTFREINTSGSPDYYALHDADHMDSWIGARFIERYE